ncbi:MAG: hypothetical protein ACM31C_19300, partial [Acidobacteriota bacterium]
VADELRKLLGARQPSRGRAIAERTGILGTILPERHPAGSWLVRVDRAARSVRLAALLVPLARAEADPRHLDRPSAHRVVVVCRNLKLSNLEAELAAQLVGAWPAVREPVWTKPELRRLLAELDRDKRAPASELWATVAPELADAARAVLGDPLGAADLAVTGKDVMAALAITPGPAVGRILALLLDRVLDDPSVNSREHLLQLAQQLELEVGR